MTILNRRSFCLGSLLATAAALVCADAIFANNAVVAADTDKAKDSRCFEMRVYYAPPGRLDDLHARFRDHTVKLFEKHGMGNFVYFHKAQGQPDADRTLLYFLTHQSQDAAKASFKAFAEDPDWKAAREQSEKKAGGSLTIQGGVKSEFLKPTDYSPTK